MIAIGIKTNVLRPKDNIFDFIKNNISNIQENDVLVIASKVVSLSENRLIDVDKSIENQKNEIMKRESDYYIDPKNSPYGLMITIKNSRLGLKAGVDKTNNPQGTFILWPENPQKSVNDIWKFLRKSYGLKNVGVVIADTTSVPLRKGFVGGCVAYCGFSGLKLFKKEDLFGKVKVTTVNFPEAIAAVGVLEMGEVDEQTPLCIVRNVPNIDFQDREPSEKELDSYYLEMENDVFYPALKNAPWEKSSNNN